MNIDISKNFVDLEGNIIKAVTGKDATLKGVIIDALVANYEDEKNLSGEEKVKRWNLALELTKADNEIDISIENISMIKKLVGKAYGVLVVGQALNMLEGK